MDRLNPHAALQPSTGGPPGASTPLLHDGSALVRHGAAPAAGWCPLMARRPLCSGHACLHPPFIGRRALVAQSGMAAVGVVEALM